MRHRIEKDVLGNVKVPKDAYYGSETQRAVDNFEISDARLPHEFIRNYAILKRAAAVANMKAGALDAKKAKAISRACDEIIRGKLADQFVVDAFQAGGGTSTNMNVNEVVANRAAEMLGGRRGDYRLVHPNDHVNMAQSTNDTFHTVIRMTAYLKIVKELIPALAGLESSLGRKQSEFRGIVKQGRTHLQDAVPITLGQEFSGYRGAVASAREGLESEAKKLLEIPVAGTAVGTGINVPAGFSSLFLRELRRLTRVNFRNSRSIFTTMQNQYEELAVANALGELAVVLNKIANDMRLLSSGPRGGLGELTLPAVQPGSSIMPGKVNPSIPEMLNMVCFRVMGNSTTVREAANAGQLDFNVFMPVIALALIDSISLLTNSVRTFENKCVRGIKANRKRIAEILEMNLGVATALVPYIGYAKAAEVARKAYLHDKSVRQVCLEMKILDRRKLDSVLDPKRLV